MKEIQKFDNAIAKAIEDYNEALAALPIAETKVFLDKLKQAQDAKSDFISNGANPCENCGALPMGIVKTPAHVYNGTPLPTLYEVGCTHCPPYIYEDEDGKEVKAEGKVVKVKRRSYSSRAYSIAETVENWNNKVYVEDLKLGLNTGFVFEEFS